MNTLKGSMQVAPNKRMQSDASKAGAADAGRYTFWRVYERTELQGYP